MKINGHLTRDKQQEGKIGHVDRPESPGDISPQLYYSSLQHKCSLKHGRPLTTKTSEKKLLFHRRKVYSNPS